jgi:hypothetical protein
MRSLRATIVTPQERGAGGAPAPAAASPDPAGRPVLLLAPRRCWSSGGRQPDCARPRQFTSESARPFISWKY